MEYIYPQKDRIIEFFHHRSGYFSVIDIATMLVVPHVQRSTQMDEEWQHIRKLLHELKSGGFLLVEGEGKDIYQEKFSSTPDRIEKFYQESTKVKNFYVNKNSNKIGTVVFNYSSNNGTYFIGENEYLFGIKFSGASQQSIYVYNDNKTLESIALVEGVSNFSQVNLNKKYDGTSRARCPKIGQIVVLKNTKGKYALIKINDIKMEDRGDTKDEITFSFEILDVNRPDLIVGEEERQHKVSMEVSPSLEYEEIKKSLAAFLSDPRFIQQKRKIETIRNHFPTLDTSELEQLLSQIGAVRYENNHSELWGPSLASSHTKSVLISGDDVAGDKVGRDKNTVPESDLLSKYWWGLLIPIVVLVFGYMITEGKIPQVFNFVSPTSIGGNSSLATSTPNLATILNKNNSFALSSEKQEFSKNYTNTIVYGSGSFVDLIKMDQGYTVLMTISNNEIGCQFGFDSEKNLILLGKGQTVNFTGLFTGEGLGGYGAVNPWYVTNCVLLN